MLRAEANILRFEQSQVNYTPPITQQHTSSASANAINKRIEHNENDHKESTSSSKSSSVAAKVTISQAAQNASANAINKRIEHNENDHKISTPTSKPSSVNSVTTKQVQDAYKKMSSTENNVLRYERDHSDTTSSSAKKDSTSDMGGEVATNVLNLIPGISNAKSLIESITGKDMVTGAHLSATDRVLSFAGTFIGGEDREVVKGGEAVGKEIVNGVDRLLSKGDSKVVSEGTEKPPVPTKDGAGSDPANFINKHAQDHMYNPNTTSTPKNTQYGQNVDVKQLVIDTKTNPDSITRQVPPNGSKQGTVIYKKEYNGNISTSDTPTGSHRVIDNLDNPDKSTHFPYVPKK